MERGGNDAVLRSGLPQQQCHAAHQDLPGPAHQTRPLTTRRFVINYLFVIYILFILLVDLFIDFSARSEEGGEEGVVSSSTRRRRMADAAEKGSPEEEDVAVDEMVELAERERDDEANKGAEQEENVLLPLLKAMFPQVDEKVLHTSSSAASK